ncbi:MAG: PIN domain-containing protein [Anaerolineae bacterium]|nr:PIN domain-containing protein [Anaerolineae bacterium]
MNDETYLQFVDTNILVYAYDQSAGFKREQASLLLQKLWKSGQGCLSLQVLQEFYVAVTRKAKPPLSIQQAKQIIKDLRGWQVHRPTGEDVLSAIILQERYDVSFWDALILQSANQLGCAVVWSEDLNPGQQYNLSQVRNPFTSC